MSFDIPVRVSRRGMNKLMIEVARGKQKKDPPNLEIQYACGDGSTQVIPFLPSKSTKVDYMYVQFDFPVGVMFKEGGITATPVGIDYIVQLQALSDDCGCAVRVSTVKEDGAFRSDTIKWDVNRLVEITATSYNEVLNKYGLAHGSYAIKAQSASR